jgi:hypothetical protein
MSHEERATAEAIITRFYERLDRPRPAFLWFDDPLSSVLAFNLLDLLGRALPRTSLWGRGRELLRFKRPSGGLIRGGLSSLLDGELRKAASSHHRQPQDLGARRFLYRFWSAFWFQLEELVGAVVVREAREALTDNGIEDARAFGALLSRHAHGFWGGPVESGWTQRRDQGWVAARLEALQRACGWWLPMQRTVICSRGLRRVLVDAEGRLHGEVGPALQLYEGHALFAWHGTPVPAEWIERRDALDPSLALTLQDARQRLAVAGITGWTKVLDRLEARVIQADLDPQIGTLLECDLPFEGRSRFLRVRCGTGRELALPVPRTMSTAREANAWTYGLQPHEYELEVRT